MAVRLDSSLANEEHVRVFAASPEGRAILIEDIARENAALRRGAGEEPPAALEEAEAVQERVRAILEAPLGSREVAQRVGLLEAQVQVLQAAASNQERYDRAALICVRAAVSYAASRVLAFDVPNQQPIQA